MEEYKIMFHKFFQKLFNVNFHLFWIVSSFIIWIFVFFGFLSSKLALVEDSISYYEHTKFFVENIVKGVFPLWDPFWFHGASNDFFLRRIGAFNPFYFIILLFESLGISYTLAYLCFLAGYYWAGMIGFYLLAMRIYNNRLIAYAGYLMLLFSALGTRLFDSYMMLVTVPLIWFFYFLVAFSQKPQKHCFLGVCLSFMILSSTYIPFYFLTFLLLFLLFFGMFYYKNISGILKRHIIFIKGNKVLVSLSLGILLFSFLPLITFFHNSNKGQIVLSVRHGDAVSKEALVVPHKTLDWGAVEDLAYSALFSDLRTYKFAVVYLPFFAAIVFVLGLFGRITRKAAFMFICAFVLFCIIIPYGLPFYDFFYKHIFYLKYFRNLHFFLWFVLIPLFVLLVLEHWKMLENIQLKAVAYKRWLLVYVLGIHAVVFIFIWLRADAIASTYVTIFLSAIFWFLMILGLLRPNFWGFALLTLTILVQPLEVYHYLSLRAKHYVNGVYGYKFSYQNLELKDLSLPTSEKDLSEKPALYYASSSYNRIYQNVSPYALAKYLYTKFLLVDRLQVIDRDHVDFSIIEKHFLEADNNAFIFNDGLKNLKTRGSDPHPPIKQQAVISESSYFRILSFNANRLRLAVESPYEKFLIYNDSYDPYWQVTINSKPCPLYQTNVGFKGVWVPEGKSIIEFHYGSFWLHAMNIGLLLAAFFLLFGIAWFSRKSLILKGD